MRETAAALYCAPRRHHGFVVPLHRLVVLSVYAAPNRHLLPGVIKVKNLKSGSSGLGPNAVRTIVDQRDQRERTSVKHLERIRRIWVRSNRASVYVTDSRDASTPRSNKAPSYSRKLKG
jgi:hypothetical protein